MEWNDFKQKTIWLEGYETIITFPQKGTANGKWALKAEYHRAFPEVQTELLKQGYHVAYVKNKTRWHVPEDTEAKARLAVYMHEELGLNQKCVVIGMSCGGMQGIYFAAAYPQYVSCMFLDAPVINLIPCFLKREGSPDLDDLWEEFSKATGMDEITLYSYRNHPMDRIPDLMEHDIPIVLVCGDEDKNCPYEVHGKILNDLYKANGCTIETILKKGGHHPHGLPDNTPILNFICKYDI